MTNKSNQPDYDVAIENPLKEDDEDSSLTQIGALWKNDSDKAVFTGTVTLLGVERRVVIFARDGDNSDE